MPVCVPVPDYRVAINTLNTKITMATNYLARARILVIYMSIFRLETLLSEIFYQPERLELQQPRATPWERFERDPAGL